MSELKALTVRELIDKLQAMPLDAEVHRTDYEQGVWSHDATPIKEVLHHPERNVVELY